jgi:hypothetical protein
MTSDSAYKSSDILLLLSSSSEAEPPTKSSTVAKRIIIMAMSTMLSLVDTSSQRKTPARCWTGTYFGGANHKHSNVSTLM